jgi:hypothetical protein
VQDRSVFGDIDLFASKHGVNSASQAAFICQLQEKFERFVGDAIFRVIEVETHCLCGQALAAFWVICKELSKMKFSDLLMVRLKSFPAGASGQRLDSCRHIVFLSLWDANTTADSFQDLLR